MSDQSATPGISDEELLRRVFTNMRCRTKGYRQEPRWASVMTAFAIGSTYANALCRRFNFDPDEMVKR